MKRLVCLLCVLFACEGDVGVVMDTDFNQDDLAGPSIAHSAITDAQLYGQDVLIEATASDNSGVFVVEMVYKQETSGASSWKRQTMSEVGGELFQGAIPGDDVGSAGMHYYLQATDSINNTSCLPEECELEPWHFSVSGF